MKAKELRRPKCNPVKTLYHWKYARMTVSEARLLKKSQGGELEAQAACG